MAHAWIDAAAILGLDLTLACPADYDPDPAVVARAEARIASAGDSIRDDPAQSAPAARGADVIIDRRLGVSMGQEAENQARRHAFAGFIVDEELVGLASPKAIVLHCLPAHRGEEISAAVLEGPRSAVWRQAENRLAHPEGDPRAVSVGRAAWTLWWVRTLPTRGLTSRDAFEGASCLPRSVGFFTSYTLRASAGFSTEDYYVRYPGLGLPVLDLVLVRRGNAWRSTRQVRELACCTPRRIFFVLTRVDGKTSFREVVLSCGKPWREGRRAACEDVLRHKTATRRRDPSARRAAATGRTTRGHEPGRPPAQRVVRKLGSHAGPAARHHRQGSADARRHPASNPRGRRRRRSAGDQACILSTVEGISSRPVLWQAPRRARGFAWAWSFESSTRLSARRDLHRDL